MILRDHTRPKLHIFKTQQFSHKEVQIEFKNTFDVIINSKLLNFAGHDTRVFLVETLHRGLIV